MLYSSGTTGVPKGVRKTLTPGPPGDPASASVQIAMAIGARGIGSDTVYLSPAPLYHSAPLVYCMATHRLGGTCVVMESFDAAGCLAAIERYRVTHAQFVPTMFTRMLRLPEEERLAYDLSSLTWAVHAAAPCPVPVKQQMMAWWGPIIHEYYAGTEDIGASQITPEEWLAHPGSVGRPLGEVHILDPAGEEVPVGQSGTVYFAGGREFEYHNDPEKTAKMRNARGWRTLGDVGHVDEDGYLYLTDRATFMIISGGVNIYPQEIEDTLVMHPSVADVAVFGIPNEDFGEEVKAVVQPAPGVTPGPELAAELEAFAREHLGRFKVPRSIDFVDELPRDPAGKLFKRKLRDPYWGEKRTHIV
jgi:fatty-acyl-CoA synthase